MTSNRAARSILFSLFSLLLIPFFLFAQSEQPAKPVMQALRVDRHVELSGRLDDELWKRATPVELPYEINPGENTAATQKTYAMVLYDAEHVYIGFRCLDTNPTEIRANLSDRDRIFNDDYVVAIIDTYGDHQRGYEVVVNPYGIQGDLLMTSNGEDESFDMVWQSAAEMNDQGWTAEMQIPFKSLQFPSQDEHAWTLWLGRNFPRMTRTQFAWTPHDRNIANLLTQSGKVTGIRGIESGDTFELLPYAISEQAGQLSDPSDASSSFRNAAIKARVGGGFKYAPSRDLTLDAVINPDFSQVESDADQISVNSTFALYYQERRPFFLEGQELLQTPMYYSRSINNPLGAARVIGKAEGLSYMYLGALDRNTPIVVPGEESSNTVTTTLQSFANVGRARYDLGDEAYVGVMLFTRNFSGGHNYLAGFDWNYKFWENWYFSGEGFLSKTKELNDQTLFSSTRQFGATGYTAGFDGESYGGEGIHVVLNRSGRDYRFTFVYNDFSPTYQTYNGLFSSVDYRQAYMNHSYTLYPEESFFTRIQFYTVSIIQFNHRNIRKDMGFQPGIFVMMKGQVNVDVSYFLVNNELFRGVRFNDVQRAQININARPADAFNMSMYANVGKFIYRSAVPAVGNGHDFGVSVTIRPTSHLKIDLSYDRAELSDLATDALFYDGYVARGVLGYQFTREMFLRSIVQYNSFGKSFSIYPLFSYKLNPLTTFYAGLTNDLQDYGPGPGFTTTARQYFVKMQYLFRS